MRRQRGQILAEMLLALALTALLLRGLAEVAGNAWRAYDTAQARSAPLREARAALADMARAVRTGRGLLIPTADQPATARPEHVRDSDETPNDSSGPHAVLAVLLPLSWDLDGDGFPDADNDRDGRVDEDPPADAGNDGKPGVRDIDDDGNGLRDFFLSPVADDDESNDREADEDPLDGLDNDGDGLVDEDPPADRNGDGQPGLAGVDDDGDGLVDEGSAADDDEDGRVDEDGRDVLLFYLDTADGTLHQRAPVPWDVTGDGVVDGRDTVDEVIARGIDRLRVERLPGATPARPWVLLRLEFTVDGVRHALQTREPLGEGA